MTQLILKQSYMRRHCPDVQTVVLLIWCPYLVITLLSQSAIADELLLTLRTFFCWDSPLVVICNDVKYQRSILVLQSRDGTACRNGEETRDQWPAPQIPTSVS